MNRFHLKTLRSMMEKAAVSLNDSDALDAVELYPEWEVDVAYTLGQRIRYEGKLYRVRQSHTSLFPPSIDTAALYEEVEKPGQGDTPDNPIYYDNNMALVLGKYYAQFGVVYHCFRDTGVAVYNDLADLVGIYVEVV